MGQTKKTSFYRGTTTESEARKKLERLCKRLSLTKMELDEGKGLDAGTVTLRFEYSDHLVFRTCSTQPTVEGNTVCLALWLEDRARNIERGLETLTEAFADSLTAPQHKVVDPLVPRVNFYTGAKSVSESIAVFRSAFARLNIAERDVKVTWDAEANLARLRMRLPSGAIVEKISRAQRSSEANLTALALWLQSRAKNWERGIENLDLDRVFAGNLLPAKTG